MEQSGAAWRWLGSLCTPSHPVLGWHLWPGYPPDSVLSPSLPSSSQTSLTHVTLLKVATPALDKKLPCLGNPTPQCQSYLLNPGLSSCCSPLPPLPVLLGAFNGLPLLSHLAQSQLSHGRDSGRHQHSVSQRSVPCPYQSPTLTEEHAPPTPLDWELLEAKPVPESSLLAQHQQRRLAPKQPFIHTWRREPTPPRRILGRCHAAGAGLTSPGWLAPARPLRVGDPSQALRVPWQSEFP